MRKTAEMKTLSINKNVHDKLKNYCNKKGLKINLFVERLIIENTNN